MGINISSIHNQIDLYMSYKPEWFNDSCSYDIYVKESSSAYSRWIRIPESIQKYLYCRNEVSMYFRDLYRKMITEYLKCND